MNLNYGFNVQSTLALKTLTISEVKKKNDPRRKMTEVHFPS